MCLCNQVPKKFLDLTPNPKIAPKGPKSAKRAPNVTKSKTKRQGSTSETQIDSLRKQVSNMLSNLTPTRNQTQKQPRRAQKVKKLGPIWAELETKRQGCTCKTKVDSQHKQVPKKCLNLSPASKLALKGLKMQKRSHIGRIK